MVVLPTPGGPQRMSEDEVPRREHRAERAVGAEELVLPDDLGEPLRAQAVGQRALAVVPRRRGDLIEQVGHRRNVMLRRRRVKGVPPRSQCSELVRFIMIA